MKRLSAQPLKKINKKALSEMMSYVFLVIIAVSLASLVYFFLKGYIVRDTPDCQDGTQLVVQSVACTSGAAPTLTVTLSNKGMWKVDGARIAIRKPGVKIATTLTTYTGANQDNFYKLNLKGTNNYDGLKPGETADPKIMDSNSKISTVVDSNGDYILEVQPAVIDTKTQERVMCKKAVITQPIKCT